MNIDEAIWHCKEVSMYCSTRKCSADHHQLAKWLEELKELRKLFTLTEEEVEPIKKLLSNKLFELKISLKDWKYREGEMANYIQKDIDTYQPILARIKQWQDDKEKKLEGSDYVHACEGS